jgi:hypothetical protein
MRDGSGTASGPTTGPEIVAAFLDAENRRD